MTGGLPSTSEPPAGPPRSPASGAAGESSTTLVRCDQCGEQVPALTWCVRCGDPLTEELRWGRAGRVRDSFAAAPAERALAPRVISTFFPALPRAHMRTFRVALVAGLVAVVGLAALGLYPVAIAASAVLVPLLTVLYVYDVDVYEDEPVRVIALTFGWGFLAGALFAWAVDVLLPAHLDAGRFGSLLPDVGGGGIPLDRAVVAPLVAGALMLAGPVVLLSQRRFNDVLDGATFGVASAVAFVGAQTLVTALDFFGSGLQPVGDPLPWAVRLLSLSVAQPLVAAGAVGATAGALWLRYRSPVRDRAALGPLGLPGLAILLAAALLVVEALALELLDAEPALAVVIALAVVALLWLRRVLHLGLLQESREIPLGEPAPCPDCGRPTPWHSFCGQCGVSLQALPKAHAGRATRPSAGGWMAPHREAPSGEDVVAPSGGVVAAAAMAAPRLSRPAEHPWFSERGLLVAFAALLVAAVLLAGVLVVALAPVQDRPDCTDPAIPCAGARPDLLALARTVRPASTSTAIADSATGLPFDDRETVRDQAARFGLEFDPGYWTIDQQSDGYLFMTAGGGSVVLVIEATSADAWDAAGIIKERRKIWKDSLLGFALDRDPEHALLGTPILGHLPGNGGLYGGSIDSAQGPTTPVSLAMVSASDGVITVVASVLTDASVREAAFELADSILGSFSWPAAGEGE